jgi:hypothetical protein
MQPAPPKPRIPCAAPVIPHPRLPKTSFGNPCSKESAMPRFTCNLRQCKVTLRFNDPPRCPAHGHALQPHLDGGLVVNWGEGCKSRRQEEAYNHAAFRMESFMPATQRGLFDVSMSGTGRQVTVTVKVFPTFTMPPNRQWGPLAAAYAALTPWSAEDIVYWKAEQQGSIDAIWNSATFQLRLRVPGWETPIRYYKPQFRIVFVERKGEAHIVAEIEKAPPTNPAMFNCGGSRLNLAQIITGNPKAVSVAALNSQSGRPVAMNSAVLGHQIDDVVVQYNIVAHEYGHMVGLPDEYNSGGEIKGTDLTAIAYAIHCKATNELAARAGTAWEWNTRSISLMSTGNLLMGRHLITAWEAATVATRDYTSARNWSIV